jgi:hypothetical protein
VIRNIDKFIDIDVTDLYSGDSVRLRVGGVFNTVDTLRSLPT